MTTSILVATSEPYTVLRVKEHTLVVLVDGVGERCISRDQALLEYDSDELRAAFEALPPPPSATTSRRPSAATVK